MTVLVVDFLPLLKQGEEVNLVKKLNYFAFSC